MSRPSFDIFLHYPGGSPEDSAHAVRLGELLERYSFRVWIAERDRPKLSPDAGGELTLEILESTPIFIACIGTRPTGSWGRREITRGVELADVVCTALLPGAGRNSIPADLIGAPVIDFPNGVTSVAPLIPLLWRRLMPDRARLLDEVVAACRASRVVVLTGPPGSGKTSLAEVAASELKNDFPDGTALLQFDPRRKISGVAGLVLRILRIGGPLQKQGPHIESYQELLSQGRYLVVLDDVEGAAVDELVPPHPSAMIVASRADPRIPSPHRAFELPPPSAPGGDPSGESQQAGAVRPGFTSESTRGRDLLAIEQPVQALCSVVAAKDVEPPLSIGLFAEWGAGKTFFIEKMRERIAGLADASSRAESSAYCSEIRQIEFNAWHYADANLWASLASRVFEGLADHKDVSGKLFEQLASSREQLREVTKERALAQRQLERAQEEEERAQREVERAEVTLSDLASSAIDVFDDLEQTKPLLDDLRFILRVEDGDPTMLATARQLRTARGVFAQLWRRSKKLIIAIVVALVLTGCLAVLLPNAIGAVLGAATTLVLVVDFLARPVRWVLSAASKAKERAETLQRRQYTRLETRLDQLREDELDAKRREEEARRRVEATEREIDEIKDGRLLFNFIDARAKATAYEPYLGLIALVRRDFERLAELIDGHVEDGDGGPPRIERIVLYIDDLDRCPADRVVEVLEAVHLLMASRLFVVVVAVDPRWLLSSLERRHAVESGRNGNGSWVPTPENYLEKIFQIPFALPQMKKDGFQRLIVHLMPTRDADESVTSPGPRSTSGTDDFEPTTGAPEKGWRSQAVASTEPPPGASGLDLEPEGLRITLAEVGFVGDLDHLVRTPRAAKRLTNLYRLIRASLSQEDLDALLGRDGRAPEFPCVLLMLAIAVGFPALAPNLLRRLRSDGSTSSWWLLVNKWAEESPEARNRLARTLTEFNVDGVPDDRAVFAKWVPQVARYSYDALPLPATSQ